MKKLKEMAKEFAIITSAFLLITFILWTLMAGMAAANGKEIPEEVPPCPPEYEDGPIP